MNAAAGDLLVALADQDIRLASVPSTRPVLVRPHQAERQVDVPGQSRSDRSVKQLLPGEPVVVVHEPGDARVPGQAMAWRRTVSSRRRS